MTPDETSTGQIKAAVFFDLGDTLASIRLSGDGTTVDRILPFPVARRALGELRELGARLGILSDAGAAPEADMNRALGEAGLLELFDPALIVYGSKSSHRIFEYAASLAREDDSAGGRLLFVGEDAWERKLALECGFEVAPHPLLAPALLARPSRLRFLKIQVPSRQRDSHWRQTLQQQRFIALHAEGATVYGIAGEHTAALLDDLGFLVDRLGSPGEPLTHELYLLRDDLQAESGFLRPVGNSVYLANQGAAERVLCSTSGGLIVSAPAGRSVESFHFRGSRHGHNLKLMASTALLEPGLKAAGGGAGAALFAGAGGVAGPAAGAAGLSLSPEEQPALAGSIGEPALKDSVDRYSGAKPVSQSAGHVLSRHIDHPGNGAAVAALAAELNAIGAGRLTIRRQRFTHEGKKHENIEATLGANGLSGIVILCAHLDSTAKGTPPYRPSADPAPGADDDASGIAAILAAAGAILALAAAQPATKRREIRFVLFNAEEQGLIGSRAYARELSQAGAEVVAVFQMDMIGHSTAQARGFELHAGFGTSADVERRSVQLAELVQAMCGQVSAGQLAPQVFPGAESFDPAEGRSDHYSFHLEGYPACLVSEDFFAGPGPDAPTANPNPDYHQATDTTINAGYAAAISRAVTAAAWVAATR